MATPTAGVVLYTEADLVPTPTAAATSAPSPAPTSISSGLLHGEVALTVDVDSNTPLHTFPHGDTTQGFGGGPDTSRHNSRRDYVARWLTYWGMDVGEQTKDEIECGAVHSLPLPLQTAFRRKILAIFALQLTFVTALVAACAFYPPVTDVVTTAFAVKLEYLLAAAGALVVLLFLLYMVRLLFPLNWLVLFVFSGAQAALFAALGVKYDTHLGVFNCGATLACVVIMLLLAGVKRPRSGWRACTVWGLNVCNVLGELCSLLTCDCDSSSSSEPIDNDEHRSKPHALLSTFVAGVIAYVVVAVTASVLFVTHGTAFVTLEGFGASLAFQFVLVLWFALDATTMYHVLSLDEYMHGVIYFYTDMVLLVVMCAAAAGVVAIATVMCEGDSCDCGGCDCGYCGDCCECGSCSDTRVGGVETGCCECNPLSPCDDRWTWADMCYWCDCFCRCCPFVCDCIVWCFYGCGICWTPPATTTSSSSSSDTTRQQTPYASMGEAKIVDGMVWNEAQVDDAPTKSCAVADVKMERV